jgi:integrase
VSISPHLVRRGNTFHFRIAVPRDLVAQLGKVEIKTTLKTSDPLTAKQRSRVLSNAIETLFDELRRMPELTRQHVERRVREYFQDCLDKSSELADLLPQDNREWDRDAEVSTLRQRVDDLKKLLANREFSPALEREVLEILHPDEPDAKKGDIETFRHACNLVLRAKIENAKLLAAEFMGEPAISTDPIFAGMRMEGYPPLPGEVRKPISGVVIRRAGDFMEDDKSISYAELFRLYLKDVEKQNIKSRTMEELKRAFRLGSEIVETTRPVNSIRGEEVRDACDLIAQLPVHFNKNKSFKGMSAREAVVANIKIAAPVIDHKTQDKLFRFFMMPIRWGKKKLYVASVPGASISITVPKNLDGVKKQRKPYDEDMLRRIFTSPLFAGCSSKNRRSKPGQFLFKDGWYWVPIIALYTGMRLSEVVQLATEDVRHEHGIWFIDIHPGVIPNTGEKKQVKSESAKRRVPLADDLITLGFLDIVSRSEKGGRLFPEIKFGGDGTPSKNFTKFWSRYGKAVGFHTEDHVFHSFRHNMADMTRDAKLHIEASTFMMGHSLPGTRPDYGNGMSLAPLKEETDKIKPPIDLVALLVEAQKGKIDVAGTEWGSKLHTRKRHLSLTSPKLPSNLQVKSKGKPTKSTQPPKDQSPS